MIEEVFKYRTPDFEKLSAYGFERREGEYRYRKDLLEGQFTLTVRIGTDGKVSQELMDNLANEPYTLYLVEDAAGEFVGSVREEVRRTLAEIAENCFGKEIFQSECARNLIDHVRERYGDELEFLWERFPENAIWRRKDNKKWYGAILTAERKKVGMKGEGKTEILDVRAEPEEVDLIVDNVRIFGGWHMNKKHWITLPLDGTVPPEELIERLEESWFLAGGNQSK